jgi:hypothetical protein
MECRNTTDGSTFPPPPSTSCNVVVVVVVLSGRCLVVVDTTTLPRVVGAKARVVVSRRQKATSIMVDIHLLVLCVLK